MKSLIAKLLRSLALRALRRDEPFVVGITGSYGKTSTKDAIASGLVELLPKGSVRFPKKSFNNEFGVPLSILGLHSPGRSVFGWLLTIWKACFAKIPPVLILELGADHKGEISSWAQSIKPQFGVITGVSPVHLEHYASYEELQNEKASLGLGARRIVFLNADDEIVSGFRSRYNTSVVSVGFSDTADYRVAREALLLRADDSYEPNEQMTTCKGSVSINNYSFELALRNGISEASLQSVGMAFAVISEMQKVPMYQFPKRQPQEIAQALSRSWQPTSGRLRPIPGIKGSLLIDDSYNAAPAAVRHGLHVLGSFPNDGRKIAALGVMAELGSESENLHTQMADWVLESANEFVGVGEEILYTIEALKEKGFPISAIHWFKDSKEAGRFLDRLVEQGDVVYVKGSQSARMEWIVKDLMAEPQRANQLLVRQEQKWLK